jgi:hypothetical protein
VVRVRTTSGSVTRLTKKNSLTECKERTRERQQYSSIIGFHCALRPAYTRSRASLHLTTSFRCRLFPHAHSCAVWSDLRRLALEGNLCESRSLVTSLRNTRCIPKTLRFPPRSLTQLCICASRRVRLDTHQAYTTRHTPASSRDTFLWHLGDTLCQRTDAEIRNWCPQPGPLSRPAAQPSPTYQPLG